MSTAASEIEGDRAEAIDRLITAGADTVSAENRVIHITAADRDFSLTIPIAVSDTSDGPKAVPLTDMVQRAIELARAERLRNAEGPDARAGTAKMQSIDSFVAHAKRFADADSAVWADPSTRRFVSVIDYHRAGAESPARWGRHRGMYECPLSAAWQAWGSGAARALQQEQFALFLDARDRDLASGTLPSGKTAPEPATLLSIAANLETFATCKAARKRDPNTGRVTVAFTSDMGVSGDIAPPPSFLIAIPVFADSEPQPLEVRLRVDVDKNGAAAFTFQIHAADEVLRAAFAALCKRVGEETALPVFQGMPEQ